MKTIPLTLGFSAIVDDGDFEPLSAHMWQAMVTPTGTYAKRSIYAGGKGRIVFMHRQMLDLSDYRREPDPSPSKRGGTQRMRFVSDSAACGKVVDHINGNTLDNRRSNLRVGDKSGNARNSWKQREKALLQELERLRALGEPTLATFQPTPPRPR